MMTQAPIVTKLVIDGFEVPVLESADLEQDAISRVYETLDQLDEIEQGSYVVSTSTTCR